jgi:hypothetical protein
MKKSKTKIELTVVDIWVTKWRLELDLLTVCRDRHTGPDIAEVRCGASQARRPR